MPIGFVRSASPAISDAKEKRESERQKEKKTVKTKCSCVRVCVCVCMSEVGGGDGLIHRCIKWVVFECRNRIAVVRARARVCVCTSV